MRLIVHIDGASRGNPGPSACAVVFLDEKGNLREIHAKLLGTATNNVAEWEALAWALELALTSHPQEELELDIRSDSLLVVRQFNGEYRIRSPELRSLADRVQALLKGNPRVSLSLRHVPREENFLADKVANQALELGRR
ncbi:ribonuclease HI family protein [Ammonifex thiophilus]|uniref:Ribonuclease HI n=1 Tax=Ammonifex thiophilus TaxID=444093 RepID=A0A3D8P6D2_9THEO|nr:ribonuclease HI family protein [Ammonifex thiophilus]RDV83656.1 ribonuclease HI [Ammonifex thiophilus]